MTLGQPFVVRCAAGIASGAALSLAFSSEDLGLLAWIALVPLFVVAQRSNARQAFVAGFVCGAVAAWGIFGWLFVVPAFGAAQFIVLGVYVSLYPACWCAGVVMLARSHVPLAITAPALWVALDMLRSHAGFLALPWATLAQSQQANLAVLQVAALGGEAAVTFVVVLGNVAIASLLQRRAWRGALAAAAAVGGVHAGGALVLAIDAGPVPIVVAAVQPSIGLLERDTESGREATWQRLEHLTRRAAQSQPALIAWPETAVGDPRHDARLAARLAALAAQTSTPLVVGASETEKFVATDAAGLAVRERDNYNSAYVVRHDAPLAEPYRKRRLVPFGEYTPMAGVVSWPRWLVPDIVAGRSGDSGATFLIPHASALVLRDGLRIGVLICWENEFADLARQSVQDGAQVLVQLTNDAWFGRTRAAAQHNAASVLRAVENHVPVVIASNSGPSQVIDARGRVKSRVASLFDKGVAIASVGVGNAGTPYSRTGDLFSFGCIACAALALIRPGRTSQPAPTLQPATLAKEAI